VDPRFLPDEDVTKEFASSVETAGERFTQILTQLSNLTDKTWALGTISVINDTLSVFSGAIEDEAAQSGPAGTSVGSGKKRKRR
jgi:hypothetical protein